MKKQKIALAVLTALAGHAAQAQTSVTVYGRLNVDMETVRTDSATAGAPADRPTQMAAGAYSGKNPGRANRLTSNSSALGFRGTETISSDLQAWFQIESGLSVDTGTGSIASRNTAVGLKSRFGDVLLGQWDTPYKVATLPIGFFRGVTSADHTNILGNAGFGSPATTTRSLPDGTVADASFDRRQGNSIQYWSPSLAGLSLRLAYAFPENKNTTTPSVASDIVSLSLGYRIGALEMRYAFEQHADYFGLKTMGGRAAGDTNRSSKDRGHKGILFYTAGNTVLRAALERLEFRNDDTVAGNIRGYARNAFVVSAEQTLGMNNLYMAYTKANDGQCERVGGAACASNGLGAHQLTAGFKHNLSKRSFLYAFYTRLDNDASGRYDIAYPLAATAPGVRTNIAALGINHDF